MSLLERNGKATKSLILMTAFTPLPSTVRVRVRVRYRVLRNDMVRGRVRVKGGTCFHKPSHSASTHNKSTQTTSVRVGLGLMLGVQFTS